MAMSMAVEMYFIGAISAGFRLAVNGYRVPLRHGFVGIRRHRPDNGVIAVATI
jgi:hypothetical protein